MHISQLKPTLENHFKTFHRPEYLRADPLICLQGYSNSRDLEIAGLIAAMLAYGRVETIISKVNDLLQRIEPTPGTFIRNATFAETSACLRGFKHRFSDGLAIAAVLHAAGKILKQSGSLEQLFIRGFDNNDPTIESALNRFTITIKTAAQRLAPDRIAQIGFLLSSPASGSACKRMNMYLRWMIRPCDGIDFGVWKAVQPSKLIMPVDTHVARIARSLGLTQRSGADWTMAVEITSVLRRIAPFDPVRYDFSLCRSGMVSFRRKAA
jgi:uncharacterized protein (TIGR02757 family)